MDKFEGFYDECVVSFQEISKKPSHYLEFDENLCQNIKDNLKKIYDFTKNAEIKTFKSNALPGLVTQNFDLEQIWQQVELQNDSVIEHFLTTVSQLVVGKNRLLFKETVEKQEDSSSNEEDIDFSDIDDDPPAEPESESEHEKPQKESTKKSVVDDDFFKLDEMERFLQQEEKKMNDPDSGNDSDESESESGASVDLFEPAPEDADNATTARYKDFFVQQETTKKARNKFLEEIDDEEEPRSSFELRQDRLGKKIAEIEEDAIQEKSWQLKGEITAENRPQNSLLEEIVEFDLTTRPAPVITEQTTMQLEDIIKQRIKDRAFDSVERKARPVETPLEYKKKLVLDQEKSKESLAQIYEREFIEQQAAVDPESKDKDEEEPPLHKEINLMMQNLFVKLDALSNFHFTPKPAIPDLKIISNLPAISMEEVAPVVTSDATLLAPEEVKAKAKGDVVGKSERTSTDKKRERRKKKLKQKNHAQRKEKMSNKTSPGLGNKYSKEKMKKTLNKVMKEKNVDKMDESIGNKSVKSSKTFFSQLEEQVRSQIKRKSPDKPHKKEGKVPNAKRLKL